MESDNRFALDVRLGDIVVCLYLIEEARSLLTQSISAYCKSIGMEE